MESRGEIPAGTSARWEKHTKRKRLPERARKKGRRNGRKCHSWQYGGKDS